MPSAHHHLSDRLRLFGHHTLVQLQRARRAPRLVAPRVAAHASTHERFGAIREALHAAPDDEAWRELCALMTPDHPDEAARLRAEWTPYALRALERWPCELRDCPPPLTEALLAGAQSPALALVRWLRLSAQELSPWWSPARPIARLERALAHPELGPLRGLRLEDVELDAALIRALARAPSTCGLHTLEVRRVLTPDALRCLDALPTLRHLRAPNLWGTLDELLTLSASCRHVTHITLDTLRASAETIPLPAAAPEHAPLLMIEELRGAPDAIHALLQRVPQLRPRALCVPQLTPDGLAELRRLGVLDRAQVLRLEHAPDDQAADEVCRIAGCAGIPTEREITTG